MQTVAYTEARANLKAFMDIATEDLDEVIITRQGGKAAVLISLESFNSMTEMMHLRSTKANAAALQLGIDQIEAGQAVERELITR